MKKAVLYARASSDLQKKEHTIESQITELRRQIKKSPLMALHTAAEGLGAPERSAPRDVSARQRV
jgi:predicted site-specific integrase-resolvase